MLLFSVYCIQFLELDINFEEDVSTSTDITVDIARLTFESFSEYNILYNDDTSSNELNNTLYDNGLNYIYINSTNTTIQIYHSQSSCQGFNNKVITNSSHTRDIFDISEAELGVVYSK